jgi:hypothetical protein
MLSKEEAQTDKFNALLEKLEESLMSRQEKFLEGHKVRIGRPKERNYKQVPVQFRIPMESKAKLLAYVAEKRIHLKDWLTYQINTTCNLQSELQSN